MQHICFNGRYLSETEPLFTAANRGFRYGDGLFETMKLLHGQVLHFDWHMERLIQGMAMLQLNSNHLPVNQIKEIIRQLCLHNQCSTHARIRLAVFRQQNAEPGFVVEATALDPKFFTWAPDGWTLELYTQNPKACGVLSNAKTANYLLYVLADNHAKAQGADEALVLNTAGNLCDGSRTNIFILQDGLLKTPGLDQGCVAGVMRRYLLEQCRKLHIPVQECALTRNDLLQADEVLLTNAIQGIRWVRSFENKSYGHQFAKQLYTQTLATIYR